MKLRELLETIVTESTLSVDVPNEEWLQDKIDYAKKKGRNEYGVPYMGSTTASVRGTPPKVRVVRLHSLRGMRREQTNVRYNDLKWLMDYMDKNKKLPPMGSSPDSEYLPYIMVAYNGEAWVNEGNHRIMAAYRLGWDTMPIEIRYFDGGERVEDGPMYPGKIGLGNTPKVKEQGVAEARSNPEQNVKLASGMKELIAIYKDISDIENWAISMTGEPKLGINPQVGISEDTPKGIYFYPLDYAVDLARRGRKLPWGDNMPYIQLFQYDRSGEMTKKTQVDPAQLKQALKQYCSDEIIQQAIDEPEYDGTPYWTIYDCLSRLGKSDETNVVRWNKVLRDLGFTSVVDDGDGWIAYNEPTQGVVLDPRIIKQHKTISNRKETSVVTPAKIEQAIFDTLDMELAANRAWQAYDPDGSKLRAAAKEYAKKPDFKPWFGKPGTEEIYDKAASWGRYGAARLSDKAWAWYKEQQAQKSEAVTEVEPVRIKLADNSAAKAWIQKVYDLYPQQFQNNHVMPMGGEGDDQQFAMFELTPSFSKRGAVEIKWIQAWPHRKGVGGRAIKILQDLARKDNIALTLYPWDKGTVSQSKLMKFYRKQGFQPVNKGSKNMTWAPEVSEAAVGPAFKEIVGHLKSLGYEHIGSGADARVWAKEASYVIKILMPDKPNGAAEHVFKKFYEFCESNPTLTCLPVFNEVNTIDIAGADYIQIDMERLSPIAKFSFEEAVIWYFSDFVQAQDPWNAVDYALGLPDTWEDYFGTRKDKTKLATNFANTWQSLSGSDGANPQKLQELKTLYKVLSMLYSTGKINKFGWDVHTENVMQRGNGELVITDPWFAEFLGS